MQLVGYILIYPILFLTSLLPFRLLYFVSDCVFVVMYYGVGYRKKVVTQNLKLVYPEKSEAEIRSIRKKFYRHMCDMFLEMIKSITISEK
ncbi:MAG: lipid A biosynthesis acyltransferase, partial [Bacteroidia bacterium]|nr:lipid A biosynthesis acyltransferase [Bacteroidia bacterium]